MTCMFFTPPVAIAAGPVRPVMLKRLIRTKIGLFCLSWIAAIIVAGLMMTVRWRTENPAGLRALLSDHDGFILVFWHEHILSMPWLWPRRHAMTALQSPHPDGRMLAHTVNHLGVRTVWGSSNRNALSGLRGLKRVLDQGRIATITPDGPRGPARTMAEGLPLMARLSGAPVLLIGLSCKPAIRLNSWDRALLPLPFGRGAIVWDEVRYPEGADLSEVAAEWAARLTAVEAEADRITGLERI